MELNGSSAARLKSVTFLVILGAAGVAIACGPFRAAIVVVALVGAFLVRKQLRPFAISGIVMLSLCEINADIGGRTIRAEDVLLFLLLAGTIVPFALGRRRLKQSPLYPPLFLFAAIIGLSALVALRQPVPSENKVAAVANAIRVMQAYLTFVVVYNFKTEGEKKLSAVINGVLFFSVVSCGVAFLQILYHQGMLPFPLPRILIEKAPGANIDWGREIFGPFIGQTDAHMFTVMLSLEALTVFCVALVERSATKRMLWLFYFVLMVLIMVRVSVRTALFALFGACCALVVVEHRTRFRKYVSALIVGYVALVALNYFATHYFESIWLDRIRLSIPLLSEQGIEWQLGTTMLGRFEYWDVAWQMTKHHPILGVGFNMYGPLSEHVISSEGITHPHNGFLHILCELGFVGFITFAWLSTVVVREIFRVRTQTDKSYLVKVADMLLFGTLIWLVAWNVPVTTFLFPKPMIVFFALLGARLAIAGNAGSHEVNRRAESVTTRSSSDERRA